MRTSKGVWSIFYDASSKSRIACFGSRAGSSAARNKDVFNASKLVLDLEAADNKYVRKFEEVSNDEVQATPGNPQTLPHPKIKRSRNQFYSAPESFINTTQATAPDYLSYALLGGQFSAGLDIRNELRQAMVREEITKFLKGHKKTLALSPMNSLDRKVVHTLAATFNIESKSIGNGRGRHIILKKLQLNDMSKRSGAVLKESSRRGDYPGGAIGYADSRLKWGATVGVSEDDKGGALLWDNASSNLRTSEDRFTSELRGCHNIPEIRRAISSIANSRDGCEFLASHGKFIVDIIEKYEPLSQLKIINSLIQLLETEKLDPGSTLVETGMYQAAVEGLLSPLKHYIDIVAAQKYAVGTRCADSITELANSAARNGVEVGDRDVGRTGPLDWVYDRAGHWQRQDALRLITGWNADGAPKDNEVRGKSFATIVRNDQGLYRCYIEALTTLQARTALLHEYTHSDHINTRDHDITLLFTSAFIKVGAAKLALEVCEGLSSSAGGELLAQAAQKEAPNSSPLLSY